MVKYKYIYILILLGFNILSANSRVAFSRPGNMIRIPNYAFNEENPYFFSIAISSEIVNFSNDYQSNYGKSSNSGSIKMQTDSGFTFGLTAGNIIDPANIGEVGFHFQKSMFKHGDVSLSMGMQDILYRQDGDEVMRIGDISFFGVLTSRKSFDEYRLAINVGAGTGKVKYDPHVDGESTSPTGTGLFLGFNLNTPYLSHNGGMELIVEYDGSGINMGTIIPFTNDYSMSLGMTHLNKLGEFATETKLGDDYQILQPDAPAFSVGLAMNIPNAAEVSLLRDSEYPDDITNREIELLKQIATLQDSVNLMNNEITALSDNNLLLQHKVAMFMDSTRVFHLKEQANQSITNRVARHLTRCLRHFYQEDYRDALVEIDKAIDLNPNIALAYARRGSIYYKLGDLQRATMNWNIALKLDPEFEEIQELLLASKEERLQPAKLKD
tara:strand:- start:552 stop:1871 length:1320 start_codon:yes stop_codon:yes gene_type:complete